MIELERAGKISRDRLTYLLQEDAQWKAKFAQWRILGVERLKWDERGVFTTESLTLEDVRAETMAELRGK